LCNFFCWLAPCSCRPAAGLLLLLLRVVLVVVVPLQASEGCAQRRLEAPAEQAALLPGCQSPEAPCVTRSLLRVIYGSFKV